MLVQILQTIWNSFFRYFYRISFTKNWTTLNFLKILYYISIWIVLFYIIFEFFLNKQYDSYVNCVVIDFLLDVSFDYIYDSVFDYGFIYPNDPGSCHFFWNYYTYIYETYGNLGIPRLYRIIGLGIFNNEIINTFFFENKFNIGVYFFLTKFILNILIFLIYSWIFIFIFFIVIHVYFSLNNVFKDYVRDINVTLHFFYFFISVILLLNILYLGYNFFDNDNIIPNELILENILIFNIFYIFFYLFLNFFLSKTKNILINSLLYCIWSIIGFILFIILFYFILISLTQNISLFSGWASLSLKFYGLAYDIGYVTILNIYYFIENNIIFEFIYILYNLI